nr:hypothetical protein [uncultured Allomuricauda sp.]
MEDVKAKRKNSPRTVFGEELTINFYSDETYPKKAVRTIRVGEFLKRFPESQAGFVYKEHRYPFVRCLRAFFLQLYDMEVDPLYERNKIGGLSSERIDALERLYKKHISEKQ